VRSRSEQHHSLLCFTSTFSNCTSLVDSARTIATRQHQRQRQTTYTSPLMACLMSFPRPLSHQSPLKGESYYEQSRNTLPQKERQVVSFLSLFRNFRKFYFLTLLSVSSLRPTLHRGTRVVPSWLTKLFFLALTSSPFARVAHPFSRHAHILSSSQRPSLCISYRCRFA
jgi:hypothetical protein